MAESASEQDEANPTFWLATKTGKMNSSYPLGISRFGTASTSSLFSHIINLYWPSLLSQEGWILVLFFFAILYWPQLGLGQQKLKKEHRHNPAILTSLVQ